jgi:crotonobetainyl-CoA:carnitine CoA-transferase CaiB-like acyl-CoA transferase
MVRRLAGVPLVGSPVRFGGERADSDLPPPGLGQHTEQVLAGLGLDRHEIERLRAANVIG